MLRYRPAQIRLRPVGLWSKPEQRVIVGADTPENGISEINAVMAEAVCHAPVDNFIGGQQIHGGVVGRRVTARDVVQLGVQELHAGAVTIIQEKGSEVSGGQLWQTVGETVLRGDHGIDGIPIGDGTGFNAFHNGRAHIMGTRGAFCPDTPNRVYSQHPSPCE